MSEQTPPRESRIRAVKTGLEFRDASEDDGLGPGYLGMLRVLFSPVNEWTEINSAWEGNFLERFAPGAWKKTMREQLSRIRSLFQHGMDPQVGDKPLGPIRSLTETEQGGYGEVALIDTSYNRDLLPGLKDGLYGASHRFKVMREQRVDRPERSDYNPDGIEERTITEARLYEFGPVTFPAYAGATAGVRSATDDFLMECFRSDPERLRAMFAMAMDLRDTHTEEHEEQDQEQEHQEEQEQVAPSERDAGAEPHLTDERREDKPAPRRPLYGTRRKETSKPWLLGPSKSTKRI